MPTAKRKHAKAQAEVVIPEKIYFRIGEVSELAKLPTYVLRFWETEFSQLKPSKSSTGQRMYRRKDVEYVMQIRRLLYEDGFTIAGARDRLREEMRSNRLEKQPSDSMPNPLPSQDSSSEILNEVRSEIPDENQAILPFLAPAKNVRNSGREIELRKLRQKLSEVLDLLS